MSLAMRLRGLTASIAFVPAVLVVVFAGAGILLVEVDRDLDLAGERWAFQGDGDAARTLLSVLAGSLITVAGLSFSITIVVLQLAASQFSPRIMRTFFGDRLTQVTIGTFVGTFAYAILVLRAVGSTGEAGFVPRLSVTTASLMGVVAVILLLVFLHHVSRMIQVSHVAAGLAHEVLARTEVLFPKPYGDAADVADATALLDAWRSEPAGRAGAGRPGFVRSVRLDQLADRLSGHADRVAVLAAPGDFVSAERTLVEVWPAAAAEACEAAVPAAVEIADERDLHQDAGFGIRQLTDIALKALSPAINDPATAVTCIGYLRSVFVRLAERAEAPAVRRFPDRGLTMVVHRRRFEEELGALTQIGRSTGDEAWVAGELLLALGACAEAAARCGAAGRLEAIRETAAAIGTRAIEAAGEPRDARRIAELLDAMDVAADVPARP